MIRRVDHNQQLIVDALRRAGASVQILSEFGKGLPDLLVGIISNHQKPMNILIEVKNPSGRCDLTEAEERWIKAWKGQVAICRTPEEALAVLDDICAGEDERMMQLDDQTNLAGGRGLKSFDLGSDKRAGSSTQKNVGM
jgi:hypothetical protein